MNGVLALKQAKTYTDLAQLGLTSIETQDNDIILTRTDGSTAVVSVPVPKDGKDGKDGIDGTNGRGIAKFEKVSRVGLVDTYRITFTDDSTYDIEITNAETASVSNIIWNVEENSEDNPFVIEGKVKGVYVFESEDIWVKNKASDEDAYKVVSFDKMIYLFDDM